MAYLEADDDNFITTKHFSPVSPARGDFRTDTYGLQEKVMSLATPGLNNTAVSHRTVLDFYPLPNITRTIYGWAGRQTIVSQFNQRPAP